MTITEFLRARLAEDETVALKATDDYSSGVWEVFDCGDEDLEVLGFFKRDYPPTLPPEPLKGDWYQVGVWHWDELDQCGVHLSDLVPTATHIARHDPARILREVQVKRALLEWVPEDVQYPFASVYSDHPDFQKEWAQ